MLATLDLFPELHLSHEVLSATRISVDEFMPPDSAYARPGVSIEKRSVPGSQGTPDVDVIIYRPLDREGVLPVLLFIHGGGYVFGKAAGNNGTNVRTAAEVGCVVVSVDYRLAPETVAPGPLEDCYAALLWVHDNAAELGVDQRRIAIAGESAGGGLAAALALLARDREKVAICFQMLIYPMLDDRTAINAGNNPIVGEFVWTQQSNRFAWRAYLGIEPGSPGVSPYAAPARATELAGLPRTYISVGSLDMFLEENLAYATRLLKASVAVELHVFPGAYHGFEHAAESRLAIKAECERREALATAFFRH